MVSVGDCQFDRSSAWKSRGANPSCGVLVRKVAQCKVLEVGLVLPFKNLAVAEIFQDMERGFEAMYCYRFMRRH